ncbi:MAG: arginine--tRNA ligase [Acidimicrobiales bacterium]
MDVRSLVQERLERAFDAVRPGTDPVVRPSDRADLQANGAIALAGFLGRAPTEVAQMVIDRLEVSDICDKVEISGNGFINLTLSTGYIATRVGALVGDQRLGVGKQRDHETVVIDYSAPNVAKEMHVGHLRTTLIGDALARMLSFMGAKVVRQNHIGDWGTPFGMLIEHLVELGEQEAVETLSAGELTRFYQRARASFDSDKEFADRSRRRVVMLQSGDPETLRLWSVLVVGSIHYFNAVYHLLGVELSDDDLAGESSYNHQLPLMVSELDDKGLLVVHDGARCVFPPGFINRAGDPLPLIVQKSDGGFGYASTDLAAIRHRIFDLGARRVLYVIGAPQAQHLKMCFAVAEMAGWTTDGVQLEHVSFGNVLGPDNKMLASRQGRSVMLVDLLNEAIERAARALDTREGDESGDAGSPEAVARVVGIGAIKYADLSTERTRDYVFDWDRMLAFEGNTGPYVQYAHARIRSIFRRDVSDALPSVPVLDEPAERALALKLLWFPSELRTALDARAPHRVCGYLHELASAFTTFYEGCRVLTEDTATRASRLLLCEVTAQVLERGLGLLGIGAPESM